MKKKVIVLLVAMFCFALPVYASNSSTTMTSPTESDTPEYAPVTSGDVLDIAHSLDSNLTLDESGKDLMVTKETSGSDIEKNIRIFFWDIVNLIKSPTVIDAYDNISFYFFYNENMERVSVIDLNSDTDFTTTYVGPLSENETIQKRFPNYYYLIFGAHDVASSLDKTMYEYSKELGTDYELPETYQNGFLWIFSNFGTDCGFEISDSTIYVELPASNTVESGISTWEVVDTALDSFITIETENPISMPFYKINIVCTEISTNTTLWNLVLEKSNGTWETTQNEATGDFLLGLSQ